MTDTVTYVRRTTSDGRPLSLWHVAMPATEPFGVRVTGCGRALSRPLARPSHRLDVPPGQRRATRPRGTLHRQRVPPAMGDDMSNPNTAIQHQAVPASIPHEVVERYTNGDCSYLAAAFHWLNGWEPLNLGGLHVVAADPDGEHAWDIRGRQPLDYLEAVWGSVEPWDPWVSWGGEPEPAHLAWAIAVEAIHNGQAVMQPNPSQSDRGEI